MLVSKLYFLNTHQAIDNSVRSERSKNYFKLNKPEIEKVSFTTTIVEPRIHSVQMYSSTFRNFREIWAVPFRGAFRWYYERVIGPQHVRESKEFRKRTAQVVRALSLCARSCTLFLRKRRKTSVELWQWKRYHESFQLPVYVR